MLLNSALNNLLSQGNSDKRLAEALKSHDSLDVWKRLTYDQRNPNINIRRLTGSLAAAAKVAADKQDFVNVIELKNELKDTHDPDKRSQLENDIALAELIDHINPNQTEEYRQRVAERKTPKDLPVRRSIAILKTFFNQHVEIPFTAGKYYTGLGFKSPSFEAVKLTLKKIYPSVSDRKIASIMQEMTEN